MTIAKLTQDDLRENGRENTQLATTYMVLANFALE